MKHLRLAVFLALVASPLCAQEGQSWVALQGGFDFQNHSARNAKDNPIFGLGGGTWFTSRWGAELSLLGTTLKSRTGGFSADEYHAQLSGLLNLGPQGSPWVPYLRAGLGGTQVDTPWSFSTGTTTRFSYHAGLGVQGLLGEHILVGLEARAQRIETLKSYTETLGLVSLGYRWGHAKVAPVVPPPPPPAPEPAPAPKVEPPPVPAEVPAPAPAPEPPAPVPAPPAPKVEPPPPARIVLDEAVLHFANGKNDLSPEGVEAIRKVAASLKAYAGAYALTVSGHTSSQGRPAFNKALGKRRAEAVARVLVEAGIPAASIATVGVGPDRPLADNATKAGQARNRRVEIEVKANGAPVEVRKTETGIQP